MWGGGFFTFGIPIKIKKKSSHIGNIARESHHMNILQKIKSFRAT